VSESDVALLACALGVLLIFAGLSGRIVVGVAGGVIAMVALSRLELRNIHLWAAIAAGAPVGAVGFVLLRVAVRARRNKSA
jgi:hypothetical protein